MSSLNSFSLLEDTTGSDPVEIAKKRQQQKQAEAAKLAQQKKAEAAKATEEATKNAKAAKKVTETKEAPVSTGDNAGFEQKRQGRVHKPQNKKHVPPKTGRQFDRHSGTGRGKEIKKQGGGAHNWGKLPGKDGVEKSIYKTAEATKEEEPTTPTTPVATEEVAAAAATTDAPADAKPAVEEEEDKTLTYDQLLEQKKKAKAAIKIQARKANEAAVDPALLKSNEVVAKKADSDDVIKVQGVDVKLTKKVSKSKKTQQKKGQTITEFFKGDKAALESLEQAHQWKGDRVARPPRTNNGPKRGGPKAGPRKNAPRSAKPAPAFSGADFPELK